MESESKTTSTYTGVGVDKNYTDSDSSSIFTVILFARKSFFDCFFRNSFAPHLISQPVKQQKLCNNRLVTSQARRFFIIAIFGAQFHFSQFLFCVVFSPIKSSLFLTVVKVICYARNKSTLMYKFKTISIE